MSAGNSHSCGVRADGTVVCWGWGEDGQTHAPEGRFVSVSAGLDHSCAVSADGTVACWGRNTEGQASAPAGQF